MIKRLLVLGVLLLPLLGTTNAAPVMQHAGAAEICIANWHHVDDGFNRHWETPWRANTLALLDLRTRPQMGPFSGTIEGYGLFVLDTKGLCVAPGMLLALTPDYNADLRPAEIAALETGLGLKTSITSTQLKEVLFDLYTVHSDPTGQTAIRPLAIDKNQQVGFGVGSLELLKRDADAGAIDKAIEVFQYEYRRLRPTRTGNTLTKLTMWTYTTMEKIWGAANDTNFALLIPPEYINDGYTKPATLQSDDFEDGDMVEWTVECGGGFTSSGGLGLNGSGNVGMDSYSTSIGGADQYSEGEFELIIGVSGGPGARMDGSSGDGYWMSHTDGSETGHISKIVSCSETIGLGSGCTLTGTAWTTHRIEVVDDDIKVFEDGVECDNVNNDTSINAGDYAGLAKGYGGNQNRVKAEDWRADTCAALDACAAAGGTLQVIFITKAQELFSGWFG